MSDAVRLKAQLQREGLMDETPAGAAITPWYIRLLSGVAGWVSALLLLPLAAWLWFDALTDNLALMLFSGLACCFLGVLLQRLEGEFVRQAGTALAMTGLLAIGLQLIDQEAWVWAVLACLCLVLYITGKGEVHRFLCAAVAALCVVLSFTESLEGTGPLGLACLVLGLAAAVLWHLARPLGQWRAGPSLVPMALAFTLAASVAVWGVSGFSVIGHFIRTDMHVSGSEILALTGLAVLPVLVVPWAIWRSAGSHDPARIARLMALIVIALLPVWAAAPGIGLALCWLVLAFAHGRPLPGVVGLVALLTYLARFYYQLETPLLHKALWLGVAGGVMLLSWAVSRLGQENGNEA